MASLIDHVLNVSTVPYVDLGMDEAFLILINSPFFMIKHVFCVHACPVWLFTVKVKMLVV